MSLVFGNVACPAGIERKRGVKFTCTVQLPGAFLVVDGVQTDDGGNVSLSTEQAVIPRQLLGQFVAINSSLPATVDCGPAPWRVARPSEKTANVASQSSPEDFAICSIGNSRPRSRDLSSLCRTLERSVATALGTVQSEVP